MHPLGSELIQTFCRLLEEEGGPDLEITRLLTRINYQVAYNFKSRGKVLGGKKQMPCFVTRFTREVFLFRKTEAAEDLSLTFAATQLIDEPNRSRKSSISWTETDWKNMWRNWLILTQSISQETDNESGDVMST